MSACPSMIGSKGVERIVRSSSAGKDRRAFDKSVRRGAGLVDAARRIAPDLPALIGHLKPNQRFVHSRPSRIIFMNTRPRRC